MQYTGNYSLKKPEGTDAVNIQDFNDNADIIDTQLKSLDNNKEGLIKNATEKTSMVDADTMPLSDSAAINATKKITFANLKAVLKTYFDNLYNNYAHPTGSGNIHLPAGGANGNLVTYGGTPGAGSWASLATLGIIGKRSVANFSSTVSDTIGWKVIGSFSAMNCAAIIRFMTTSYSEGAGWLFICSQYGSVTNGVNTPVMMYLGSNLGSVAFTSFRITADTANGSFNGTFYLEGYLSDVSNAHTFIFQDMTGEMTFASSLVNSSHSYEYASVGTYGGLSVSTSGKYSQMSGGIERSGTAGNGLEITFATEDNDDFNAINIPSSASRITIPFGVQRVKFYFVGTLNADASVEAGVNLYKNGSFHSVIANCMFTQLAAYYHAGHVTGKFESAPIAVSSGDYFTLVTTTGVSGGSNPKNSSISAGSKFGMEVMR